MPEPKSISEPKSIEPLTRPPLLHVSVQESLRKYIQ
ncbi:MAG: GntR family transcriptional regulator, partial [Mesorhizobium sp.]